MEPTKYKFFFGCEEPKRLEIPGTEIANSKCLFGSQIQEVDGNCIKVFIGRMAIFKVVGLSDAFKAVYNIMCGIHIFITLHVMLLDISIYFEKIGFVLF